MYTQNTYSDYFHENCGLQVTYYVVKVAMCLELSL